MNFKDAYRFHTKLLKCQSSLNISKKHEMTLKSILEVKIFYLWGIDFMGSFLPLDGKDYILLSIDYVFK